MDRMMVLENELKRLHEDYNETDPFRKDEILKVIDKIVLKLLEEENGQSDNSKKK